MKAREDMILRQVGEKWVIFPIGDALNRFNRLIDMNETGAFLYEALSAEKSIEELAALLKEEYEIDMLTAKEAVESFVAMMQEEGLLA